VKIQVIEGEATLNEISATPKKRRKIRDVLYAASANVCRKHGLKGNVPLPAVD
jgi:hypothetical protein